MKARTRRRIYLREAALILAAARLAVRLVPAARLFAWAGRPCRRLCRFATDDIGWVAWAVETIGARRWMRAPSLPRALAAHAMLRRRGIASKVCLGVARDGDALTARAWVEVGGKAIGGGAENLRFTRMAGFGGAPP